MKKLLALLASLLLGGHALATQQTLSNTPAGIVSPANHNFTELYTKASVYNVKTDFNAFTDGSNLAATTVAIQAAITAACANSHGNANGGVVFFPPGEYASGPVVQPCAQVFLQGSGRGTVKITFVPSGDSTAPTLTAGVADPGTWLTVASQTGTPFPQPLYYAGIKDIRISTNDLTFQKNAIFLGETSQYYMDGVVIDKFWGNNSIGLHVHGHEALSFTNGFIQATIPFSAGPGMVLYGGVPYSDGYYFQNFSFIAPHGSDPANYYPSGIASGYPNTVMLIEDGTAVTNWHMIHASWVGGANAIYWKQTVSSGTISYDFEIDEGRKEQSPTGSSNGPHEPNVGFIFDFTGAPQRLNDLTLRHVYVSGTHTDSGIYARRVEHLTLDNFANAGYTADSLYVMDVGDVYAIKWVNVSSAAAGSPSTINIGANIGTMRNAAFRQNVNLPISADWTFESAPRVAKTLAAGSQGNWTIGTDIGGFDFPRGVRTIYFTTTAGAATLTGLPAPVSTTGLFTSGDIIALMNANGGNKLTLPHNSGSETTAANRFECTGAQDTDLLPGQTRFARYDYAISRYVIQ